MAFNINEIKANLKYGGARNTQFQVVISNPINPVADTVAPFLCRAASIPGSYLGTIDVPYFGRKWPVAGEEHLNHGTSLSSMMKTLKFATR
jgi:hypothetical protein